MKAIKFKGVNHIIAESQDEYRTLPAFVAQDKEGTIVTCFELTPEEIRQINQTGKLWHVQLAFQQNMQPFSILTESPMVYNQEPAKKKVEPLKVVVIAEDRMDFVTYVIENQVKGVQYIPYIGDENLNEYDIDRIVSTRQAVSLPNHDDLVKHCRRRLKEQ